MVDHMCITILGLGEIVGTIKKNKKQDSKKSVKIWIMFNVGPTIHTAVKFDSLSRNHWRWEKLFFRNGNAPGHIIWVQEEFVN